MISFICCSKCYKIIKRLLEELYLDSKVHRHRLASKRAAFIRCEMCREIMDTTGFYTVIFHVTIEDKKKNIFKPSGMDVLRKCLLALVVKERGY